MKKIAVSGSTGFIASYLIPILEKEGYSIVPLIREDFKNTAILSEKLKDCTAVINLAGAPIVKRWSEKYKKELYSSRVTLTETLANTINSLPEKPELFISASAVGIYKDGKFCNESCRDLREDFLGKLCKDWENAALKCQTRTVVVRIGVVLGKNGGIIKKISLPFKLGLGGRLGNGKQGFSWIHIDDLTNIMLFALQNKNLSGIVNGVSPNPVTNAEFTSAVSKVLKRPAIFPAPSFLLKAVFKEGAKLLLEGQKAVPEKLEKEGFKFKYPEIEQALKQVFSK